MPLKFETKVKIPTQGKRKRNSPFSGLPSSFPFPSPAYSLPLQPSPACSLPFRPSPAPSPDPAQRPRPALHHLPRASQQCRRASASPRLAHTSLGSPAPQCHLQSDGPVNLITSHDAPPLDASSPARDTSRHHRSYWSPLSSPPNERDAQATLRPLSPVVPDPSPLEAKLHRCRSPPPPCLSRRPAY